MSSAVKGVGTAVGTVFGGIGGGLIANLFGDIVNPPKAPTLAAPNALSATPTQADAAAPALKGTLDREKQAASTATVLTGGQGLLDTPSTTSRTLLGS